MDKNKLVKLKEIGYKIQPCCRLCQHCDFKPMQSFGTCKIQEYEHLKHSDKRKLSINALGICPEFALDEEKVHSWLGVSWTQFVNDAKN